LKCPKFNFGWGCDPGPGVEAYSAHPDHHSCEKRNGQKELGKGEDKENRKGGDMGREWDIGKLTVVQWCAPPPH